MWKKFEIYSIQFFKFLVRKGRAFYATLYQDVFFSIKGGVINTLGAKLQLFIKAVNAWQPTKYITANSSSKYTRSLIKWVNRKEDGYDT